MTRWRKTWPCCWTDSYRSIPIKIYDDRDRNIPFIGGRKGTVDVHGGWSDASGDVGKHLSHLSFAIYMNPQQAAARGLEPARIRPAARRAGSDKALLQRLRREAAYGADFLVRMQDPQGISTSRSSTGTGRGTRKSALSAPRGTGRSTPPPAITRPCAKGAASPSPPWPGRAARESRGNTRPDVSQDRRERLCPPESPQPGISL